MIVCHQSASLIYVISLLLPPGKSFKFFASMAKLINCWRENCWAIFSAWRRHYGDESAFRWARCQPPRCLAGRWGSTYATESFLVEVAHLIAPVLKEVLSKRAGERDIDVRVAEDGPDDLRVEAQTEYRRRLGRWSRDSLTVVSDTCFWFALRVSHKLHAVLNDVMLLCNKLNFMRIGTNRHVMESRGGVVFHLATGAALKYASAIDGILQNRAGWTAIVDHAPLGAIGSAATFELINLISLNEASGFYRRVVFGSITLSPEICNLIAMHVVVSIGSILVHNCLAWLLHVPPCDRRSFRA
jgi:hypothetical protein